MPGRPKLDLQSITGPKFPRTGLDCRYCTAGPPYPCLDILIVSLNVRIAEVSWRRRGWRRRRRRCRLTSLVVSVAEFIVKVDPGEGQRKVEPGGAQSSETLEFFGKMKSNSSGDFAKRTFDI